MNAKDVVVLVWDDYDNFKNKITQERWNIEEGKSLTFKDVLQFNSLEGFSDKLKDVSDNQDIIIACHVRLKDFSLYRSFKNSGIRDKFNIPYVAYLSSDGDAATKNFKKEFSENEKILYYHKLSYQIETNEFKPITKSYLLNKPITPFISKEQDKETSIQPEGVISYFEDRYFLVKKSKVLYFLGGAVVTVFLAFGFSYSAVMNAIEETSGKQTLDELNSNAKMIEELLDKYQAKIKVLEKIDSIENIVSHNSTLTNQNLQYIQEYGIIAYSSGWISLSKGQRTVLQHNLGYIPSRVFVQVAQKLENGQPTEIYLAEIWKHTDSGGRGVMLTNITNRQLTIRAGGNQVFDTHLTTDDTYRDAFEDGYVKVMMWK